ncbi:MAG: hypothetical protein CMD81_08310 [Gammaproteobacteria bacterium]|nr:hypothetical protein [Gammaproteobacteria bacterium]|tara:strand:- start:26 stop:1201 length:1176 start_codon:yes stop_codon:yes gene_type:complete
MKINHIKKMTKAIAALALFASTSVVQAQDDMLAALAIEKTAGYEQETISSQIQQTHGEPISILTSIRPIALLVDAVIPQEYKSAWNVQVLVPPQSSVHDYQLKPSDVVKMKSAQKMFWLGKGAEPSFAKSVERFSINDAPFTSAHLHWLLVQGDEMELDHHGHNHEPGSLDPHIWLSLPDAPKMLTYIANQLEQTLADTSLLKQKGWSDAQIKAQKAGIKKGLKLALAEQQRLMKSIESLKKSSWSYTKYISFHNAFAYLDDAFQVESLGSFVQNPEDGIAPRQLQKLQQVVEDEEVGCLFVEPSADGRRITSLLPDHFKVVDLDILAISLPQGVDWSGYWEYVTEQLQICFSSPAIDESMLLDGDSTAVEEEARPQEREERILDKLKFFK